jgi:hypothetical protein
MTARTRVSHTRARLLAKTVELRMFLGYALIVFRPGAAPPQHPKPGPHGPQHAPTDWTDQEYQDYIDEARRDMDGQQADKRDIRARAQIVLTSGLVLGAAVVASYDDKSHPCLVGKVIYLLAGVFTTLTVLAAGGIISAQSRVGAPNLHDLLSTDTGGVRRRLADEYAATRHHGAEAVAVLVTVLRDCVLSLVLAAGALAIAHIGT